MYVSVTVTVPCGDQSVCLVLLPDNRMDTSTLRYVQLQFIKTSASLVKSILLLSVFVTNYR